MTGLFARIRRKIEARTKTWARPRAPESLPMRFNRRRIYVLPTGFGLFFATLLGVMLLGALNYNNNPALLLALLLAGAAHTGLFAAHLQLSGLHITSIGAEPASAGKPLQLRVHARAEPGRERRGLHVACGEHHASLSLDQGSGEAVIELPTLQRGWLEPGRLRVWTTRPLGLVVAWGYVWPDTPLLVYPMPEAHGPPLPEGGGDRAVARMHPSGDDVHHLRAYRRGDSRRAIAWKPSARRNELLVREFEQPVGADIELHWGTLIHIAYEQRIRRLARWVDDAERGGRRYRLILPGQPALGPARGAAHRHACLKALALMPEVARYD